MIVPCRSAQNGVWQILGNRKAQEFPATDSQQPDSPPDSQTSARRAAGAARGEGRLPRAEERKSRGDSGFSRLGPALANRLPPSVGSVGSVGSGGPGPAGRPRAGGAAPAAAPRRACRPSPPRRWQQRRRRHGAPRGNPRPGSGSGAGPPPPQATQAILRESGSRDSAVFLSLSIHGPEDPRGSTYSVFVVGIRLGR